jgi:hypothetical protein
MAPASTLSSCARRVAGSVLALVSLAAAVAGCALTETTRTGPVALPPAAAASASTASVGSGASTRLVLRFDGHVATAILDDKPVARRFAAMLPLTVRLSDPMGQAKSGPLPHSGALDVTGADRTFRTLAGELSYWSPTSKVAIVHSDLGQRVPDPGLVRLGLIDSGLADIAAAGNDVTVRIEVARVSGP